MHSFPFNASGYLLAGATALFFFAISFLLANRETRVDVKTAFDLNVLLRVFKLRWFTTGTLMWVTAYVGLILVASQCNPRLLFLIIPLLTIMLMLTRIAVANLVETGVKRKHPEQLDAIQIGDGQNAPDRSRPK